MKKLAALPRITVAMSLAALPAVVLAQAAPVAQPELSEIEVLAKRVNARNRVDTPAPIALLRRGILPALRAALGRRHDEARARRQLPERHRRVRRALAARHRQRVHAGPGQRPPRHRRHERQHGHRRPHPGGAGRARRDHPQPLGRHRQPGHRRHAQHHPEGRRRAFRRRLPRLAAYYNDGETNPSAFLSFGDSQRHVRVEHVDQLPGALQPQGGDRASSARSTARAARSPRSRAVVEDPDERESDDIAWTGDLRTKSARAASGSLSAFYMDTDRAETEIGREFAAEDDDGEFEAEAEQANQLDAFHETNYGVVHRLRVGRSATAIPGTSSSATTRPSSSRVETNWVDDLDFDFDAAGISDARQPARFPRPVRPGHHRPVRGRAAQRRGPARGRVPRRRRSTRTPTMPSSCSSRPSTYQLGGSKLKLGVEGYRPQPRLLLPRVRDGRRRARGGRRRAVAVRRQGPARQRLRQVDHGLRQLDARARRARRVHAASTSTRRFPRRSPRRPTSSRPIGIVIDGNQINVTEDSFEFNPSAHYRWDVTRPHAAAPVGRPHRAPAELRPAEPDAHHRRRGEHPRQPDARPGNGARLRRRRRLRAWPATTRSWASTLFYRDVSDKIELDGVPDGVNEIFQEFVDEDIEATVWVNNPNDGKIWGVEFDFSSPVSFISRRTCTCSRTTPRSTRRSATRT